MKQFIVRVIGYKKTEKVGWVYKANHMFTYQEVSGSRRALNPWNPIS